MDLNLNVEFLLQVVVYIASLGIVFGKLTSRMDNHDYKIDKLEQRQDEKLEALKKSYEEKIDNLDRNHSEKINRLEVKQDKHNQLIERMYSLEQNFAILKSQKDLLEQKVNTLENDEKTLEQYIKNERTKE